MRKRREINVFSISFLDLLSGALGAVIILYVAMPKPNDVELEKSLEQQEAITKELLQTQVDLETMKKKLEEAQQTAAQLAVTVEESKKQKSVLDADIGFRFKGKRVVFLIDTSYSMTEEERMGQVKGGIKMLLINLSPEYQVDIVQYPFGERAPFKTFWGRIQNVTEIHRMEAFEFIYKLRPLGATPTRDALKFILQSYENITDLVLLSDGAPTLHNSNKKDDIEDILRMVREENASKKIQISTVGVGSDFVRDRNSPQYKFLSQLAEEHGGFFMGF